MSFSKSPTRPLRRLGNASRRLLRRLAVGSIVGTSLLGCATDPELKYLGSDKELSYYKTAATTIDYPAVDTQTSPQASIAKRPRTVFDREKEEVWEISLSQAIQTAIQNNSIIRSRTAVGGTLRNLDFGRSRPLGLRSSDSRDRRALRRSWCGGRGRP